MAWRTPRCKQYHVDLHIVPGFHVAMRDTFRSSSDARKAALVDGHIQIGGTATRLDLNENDQVSATRDQVDLTCPGTHTAVQYAPSFEAQPPCRYALALPPALFRRQPRG
jgi:hypothetical protein